METIYGGLELDHVAQSPRVNVLGVEVHSQQFTEAVDQLLTWARETPSRYVCTCPVYTIMRCREDRAVGEAVNQAAMVAADGMPVVWVQRWYGHRGAERVYGPDVVLAVCEQTRGTGLRHFFLGGTPGVTDKLTAALEAWFPGLTIAGTYMPPLAEVEAMPDPAVVAMLRAAKPDFIWVGLGSPKQDLWMALYQPELAHGVFVGVGAAFDFLSGTKRQAPRWMQQHGLEWLFRLAQEPRRLARRYLVYNPLFMMQMFMQIISGR